MAWKGAGLSRLSSDRLSERGQKLAHSRRPLPPDKTP